MVKLYFAIYSDEDKTSGKFWEISNQDFTITTRFGKVGSEGRTSSKEYSSKSESEEEIVKIIKSKINKGYEYIKGNIPSYLKTIISTNMEEDTIDSNKNYKSPPQKKTKKKVQHRNCNEGYICPDDKICNTRSGRCVRKSSKLLDYHISTPKNNTKRVETRNCNKGYICPTDKVCNTRSGRCVRTTSKLLDNVKLTPEKKTKKKETKETKETNNSTTYQKLTNQNNKPVIIKKIKIKKTKKNIENTISNNNNTKYFEDLKKQRKVVFTKQPILADKFYDSNLDMEYKETGDPQKMFIFNGDSGERKNNVWKFTNQKTGYKCDPTDWYISEKYDGVRAVWNGSNFISRQNKKYNAPEWFKNIMPPGRSLDGELHCGKGGFQLATGITRHLIPNDKDWTKIIFQVFDVPDPNLVNIPFSERIPHIKDLVEESCIKWNLIQLPQDCVKPKTCPLQMADQILIKDMNSAYKIYKESILAGAEGVMLRKPDSKYEFKRSKTLLKWKPVLDSEAVVIDYNEGAGKYKGFLGTFKVALINDQTKEIDKTKIFNLSGRLTEHFRKQYKFTNGKISSLPKKNDIYPFKDDIVNFTFMEYTNDGIPRQPIFQRVRKEL